MFFFCITFLQNIPSSPCDVFYPITPNLYFRPPKTLFGNIQRVLKLHGSLENIKNKLQNQSAFSVQIGFGISPHHAELACYYTEKRLYEIPIEGLKHLEGLDPWTNEQLVNECITDLQELGYQTIEDLYRYPLNLHVYQERWQNIGHSVHQKIFNPNYKTLIPLYEPIPQNMKNQKHFNPPIYEFSYLINDVIELLEKNLEEIKSLNKTTDQITVTYYFEFTEKKISKTFFSLTPHTDLTRWKKIITPHLNSYLTQTMKECHYLGIEHMEVTALLKEKGHQQLDLFDSTKSMLPENENAFLSYLKNTNVHFERCTPFTSSDQDSVKSSYEPSIRLSKPIALNAHEVLNYHVHPLLQERVDTYTEQKHFFLLQNHQGQLLWVYFSPNDHQFYLEGFFE